MNAAQTMLRAIERAASEKIYAFPTNREKTTWRCKTYDLAVTGPRPQDVVCSCEAALHGNPYCKHAVCVVFARKHRLPVAPRCPKCGMALADPLHDVFCQG